MSGKGNVTSVDNVNVRNTNKPALRLWTDTADIRCCVYIKVEEDHPKIGDYVEWDNGHVYWNGKKIKKIGYAFDPNEPFL